jgi:hypothetical protein
MNAALASSELLYFTERGSGPPLLLVHGLMVTGEMFDASRGRLERSGGADPPCEDAA